jgi:hypothetical protein
MEGFSDQPSELYNKEGAIYHFYGAIFAAAWLGRTIPDIGNAEGRYFPSHEELESFEVFTKLIGWTVIYVVRSD